MVVFTCNHCGDSLQKPKVEKHYSFVCRINKSLTCVDCLKDFRGEEYASHTKCITEDERYAAKGTYVNGIVKKGEVKQETWVEMIKSILDNETNLKPSCRNLLNTISSYSNIPRKKPKFINFIRSSSGGKANMKDVEEVWNIIEKYKNEKNKSVENGNTTKSTEVKIEKSQTGSSDTKEDKDVKDEGNEDKKRKMDEKSTDTPKKKKRKIEKNQQLEDVTLDQNINISDNKNGIKEKKHKKEETSNMQNETVEAIPKFSFQDKIIQIVTTKGSIPLKKLEKKVVNAYLKETGLRTTEAIQETIRKFHKKLRKVPNLEVNDDRVTINQ